MANPEDTPPKQQTQQPQPSEVSSDVNGGEKYAGQNADLHGKPGGLYGENTDITGFNRGILKLYEAIQNEPIPDEILAIIDKLAKKEQS
jgi:hypothetical protein